MKRLFSLMTVLFAVVLVAVSVTMVTGFDPYAVALVTLALSFVSPGQSGVLFAGLNQEIWTDILVKNLKKGEDAQFISELPDHSDKVIAAKGDNDIIHLVDVGADPEVLINNTTYPLPVVSQADRDIAITLDKFQTEATQVTDDELAYIAYDKISLVQAKHIKAINAAKFSKAAHALAPQGDTPLTPVIATTGADDGTGRKKMRYKDLLALKRKFDSAGFEAEGRILVLSPDHYNDLLDDPDLKNFFSGQYLDEGTGNLNKFLAGFKIYWYLRTPYFRASDKTKVSYGAIPQSGYYRATIAFVADDMFRATGRTKNYASEPEPKYQAWLYNVRHNFIALPKKQRSIGAIISAQV